MTNLPSGYSNKWKSQVTGFKPVHKFFHISPIERQVSFPGNWTGLGDALVRNRIHESDTVTSEARSEQVMQLLPGSSVMLVLVEANWRGRNLTILRPLCERGHTQALWSSAQHSVNHLLFQHVERVWRKRNPRTLFVGMYWVGQKFHLSFSIVSYGETWMNFLANPINWCSHCKEQYEGDLRY